MCVCLYIYVKYFKQRSQKPEDGVKKSGTITSKFCMGLVLALFSSREWETLNKSKQQISCTDTCEDS
jgi:hypothetical protein